MKLTFHGGAQTVTGSQTLVSVNGSKVLIDCGLFQGRRQEAYDKNCNFPFDPKTIDAVLLTHAHMDHSGNLPNLVKCGFDGPIYCTLATADLCKIMLRDSAYLQVKDLEWVNRIRRKHRQPEAKPLYDQNDVDKALGHFTPMDFDTAFHPALDVETIFRDSGHILGSAGFHLHVEQKGHVRRLGISGDIGRNDMPLTKDPNVLRDLDMLLLESTYGDRLHGETIEVEERLVQAIQGAYQSGGKVIIPAFAVGRTQTLVYVLHKLYLQNRIPDIPIFVDSPLAWNATKVYSDNLHLLDRESHRLFMDNGTDPFHFRLVRYTHEIGDSKKINELKSPHVIISSSGMCEGGRILHHLSNNLGNPNALVLFVGYAAKETLARKIMDGMKEVKIYGEEYAVRCKVDIIDAFSAHADKRGLLDYVRMNPPERLKQIFLMHGETEQALPLRDTLRSMGYKNVHYPAPGEMFQFD